MSRLIAEQPPQPRGIEQQRGRPGEDAAEPPHRDQARRQAESFGDDGAERRPANAEVEPQHEQRGEPHVDDVDGDLQRERDAGAGKADQPSDHHVAPERERGRPDAHEEIGLGRRRHRLAAAHQVVDDARERRLQHQQGDADRARDHESAHEHRALLLGVAGAERLRGERHRAHAQEAEDPEDEVEYQRRHGDGAEQVRLPEAADHRGADDAEQRRRQVGHHGGSRDGEHAAVGDALQRPRGARTRRTISQIGTTTIAPSRK